VDSASRRAQQAAEAMNLVLYWKKFNGGYILVLDCLCGNTIVDYAGRNGRAFILCPVCERRWELP
jgi:hypothetical protein